MPGWAHERRKAVALTVRWVLTAVALGLLFRLGRSGWPEIRRAASVLATREAHLLVPVIGLQVLWAVSLAQLTRRAVLAVGGAVSSRDALRISMAAFTLSRVVPGGGAAGGVFATRELVLLHNPLSAALAAMVVSWTVATTSLASLVLAGTSIAAFTDHLPLNYLVPSAAVLSLLVGIGALIIRLLNDHRLRQRVIDRVRPVAQRLHASPQVDALAASLGNVADGLDDRRRLLQAGLWSVTAWAADAAALWLVFAAFGHRLSLGQLVIGYSFANLLNSMPELTPGWIGVFEVAMTATYTALGVPAGIAVVAVVSYRLVSFWLPVAAGVAPAISSLAAHRPTPTSPRRRWHDRTPDLAR
ncbi:MAG TPA: lysylphosphatidylglycerol synthase transmembrane domain-containing protein [Nitriliruptorales bacterium]|nr:lysylphosphatidylglycerol synthase transmembrane domain-containing protein [Nitriliruptorales bacterium]